MYSGPICCTSQPLCKFAQHIKGSTASIVKAVHIFNAPLEEIDVLKVMAFQMNKMM